MLRKAWNRFLVWLWRKVSGVNHVDVFYYEPVPAADVVERKRGEWVFVEQRFYHGGFINLFRCSECKGATDREHNFCPNCGADMRVV